MGGGRAVMMPPLQYARVPCKPRGPAEAVPSFVRTYSFVEFTHQHAGFQAEHREWVGDRVVRSLSGPRHPSAGLARELKITGAVWPLQVITGLEH